jgi:hypothetical protein
MSWRSLIPLLAGLVLASCSEIAEQPLAPEAGPPAAALSTDIDLTGVLQFVELPDLGTNRHAEAYIRASEGGVVELNGFRVEIPAGALPADTLVTIDLPTDEVLGQRVIAEFGPHGVQFNEPVTLVFPLEGVLLTGNPLEVARWENDAWTSLGGTVTANGTQLRSTTPHFSTYAGKDVMAGG